MENINLQSLAPVLKVLYRTRYKFTIQIGGTPEEAHAAGLKEIAKIAKLRKLAQEGQIIKH